jgi:hypothetical protein
VLVLITFYLKCFRERSRPKDGGVNENPTVSPALSRSAVTGATVALMNVARWRC